VAKDDPEVVVCSSVASEFVDHIAMETLVIWAQPGWDAHLLRAS